MKYKVICNYIILYSVTMLGWLMMSNIDPYLTTAGYKVYIIGGMLNCVVLTFIKPTKHMGGLLHWMIWNQREKKCVK